MVTVFLPIRDIISPDIAQHFAADADLDGFAPGHHAARRREDARAETSEHFGHIIATEIDAAPWAADPLDARDQALAVRSVFQKDTERLDGTGALLDGTRARRAVGVLEELEPLDVAFVLQDAGDLGLQPGRGHVDARVLRGDGVAKPGEHVSNRICHSFSTLSGCDGLGAPALIPYQLLFVTPVTSPSSASLRKHRRHNANFRM